MRLFARSHSVSARFLLTACILLSVLGHGLASLLLERFGPHQYGAPLSESAVVMVNLKQPQSAIRPVPATGSVVKPAAVLPATATLPAPVASSDPVAPVEHNTQPDQQQPAPPSPAQPPQQQTDSFRLNPDTIVAVQQEILTYQISLLGVPVGSGRLEASNKDGELRIITRVRSNSVMSALYPVDNRTDTRLIKGRYLLTRIKQREGFMQSDTGFNLMFHERKLFWVDRIRKVSNTEPLTDLDTLDVIAGFYYLRQQPLSVGATVTLRLYDGDTTTLVPVEVLRQERLALPGMRSAETLVIQPTFSEHGFFRNNKELLIWLTDDTYRVPVRIEATTPIGRVTAELVASERTVSGAPRKAATSIVLTEKMQYN